MKTLNSLFFLFIIVFAFRSNSVKRLLFELPCVWNQVEFKFDPVSEARKYTLKGESIGGAVDYLAKVMLFNSAAAVLERPHFPFQRFLKCLSLR